MSYPEKGSLEQNAPPPPYPGQQPAQYNYPNQTAVGYSQPGHYPQYNQNQTNVLVAPGPMTMTQTAPPDHMNLAIFVTLCCFWPTGIIAIMKASESRSAAARGDLSLATSSAKSAKQMANISIAAGVCSLVFGLIIVGVYVGVILGNVSDY